jgi:hypothetical protein
MDETFARYLLEQFGIRAESNEEQERLIKSVAETIRARFGRPIFPKRGESLAVSMMTPKTAALAFDRVYRFPMLADPIPEEVGFYCATFNEIAFAAVGTMILVSKELGFGNELTEALASKQRGPGQAAQNEKHSLRLLCAGMERELEILPTILYDARASMEQDFRAGPEVVLKAAISNVAMVDEESLTWDQVIEFRRDKRTQQKYRRFVRWAAGEFKARSPHELQDMIAVRLDDYTWGLKKHGIKASLGAISCLLDPKFLGVVSAATAATAVATNAVWAAVAGASLTVGKALVSFGTELVDGIDENRRRNFEVAYLYEVQKRLR